MFWGRTDVYAVICMDSALYYQKAITAEPEYLSVATERWTAWGGLSGGQRLCHDIFQ